MKTDYTFYVLLWHQICPNNEVKAQFLKNLLWKILSRGTSTEVYPYREIELAIKCNHSKAGDVDH
jgi:hypothetical protein